MVTTFAHTAWIEQAFCAAVDDPEPWLDAHGPDASWARMQCWTRCPVRTECLAAALHEELLADSNHVRTCIRGGLSPSQRKAVHNGRAEDTDYAPRECEKCLRFFVPGQARAAKYCRQCSPSSG